MIKEAAKTVLKSLLLESVEIWFGHSALSLFTPFVNLGKLLNISKPHMSSVQFSRSVVSDSLWPRTIVRQASLSITNSWSLPKPMSIESVMPSNHLILCHPLLLLPSIFPSVRVFSNESVLCIRWPKYWSSNEYSGLTSLGVDWLDLLSVQGTLNSLLQHHSSKASILQCSACL